MIDEPGSFYICTETSPRCYIIQKVSAKHVDQVMNDLFVAEERWMEGENPAECRSATPPPPILPWWFTPECERQLETGCDSGIVQSTDEESSGRLGVDESDGDGGVALTPSPEFVVTSTDGHQSLMSIDIPVDGFGMDVTDELGNYSGFLTNGSASFVPTPMMGSPRSPEELKMQLRSQLEYYFSRENLATDRYLRSQMDNDQYVPIRIIATFPKVMRLTSDLKLIVQVLRDSPNVQVDERGERVRPICKRCTIILREIPESTERSAIEAMFSGGQCPPYLSLDYGLNNSWYVTFDSEEATQKAFLHLQTEVKTFKDRPICARIKTGNAPQGGAPSPQNTIEEPFTRLNGFRQMPPPTSLKIGSDKSPYSLASPDDSNMISIASTTDGPATSMSFVSMSSNMGNGYHPSVSPMGGPMMATYPASSMLAHSPSSGIGFDLGHILASYGYVPRATYRPDATVVHVTPQTMAMSLHAAAAHSPHYTHNQAQTSTQQLSYRTRASSSISHYGADAHHHMGARGPSPHPTGRYRGGGRGGRGGGSYYQHGGHSSSSYGTYDRAASRGRGRAHYGRTTLQVRSRTPPEDDTVGSHPQLALGVGRTGPRGSTARNGEREMRQRSASDFQSHYDKIRPRGTGVRRPIFLGAKDASAFHYNSSQDYSHPRIRNTQPLKDGRVSVSPAVSSTEEDSNNKDVDIAPKVSIAKSDSMLEKASVYNFDPSSFPSLPNAMPDDATVELDVDEQPTNKAADDVPISKDVAAVATTPSPPPAASSAVVSSNESSLLRAKTPPAAAVGVPTRKPTLSFSSVAAGTASAKSQEGRVAVVEAVEPVAVSSIEPSRDEETNANGSSDATKRMSYAQMAKTHKSTTSSSSRSAPSPEAVSQVPIKPIAKEPSSVPRVFPHKRYPAPTC